MITRRFAVALVLLALVLTTGGAAADPPVVPVALPVARHVLDWEEFAGRIQAAESVEMVSRVTGF